MKDAYIYTTFVLYVIGWVYSMYHKERVESFLGGAMMLWGLKTISEL